MTTTYPDPAIWLVIVAIGIVTFSIRGSFIALFGRLDEVPPRVDTLLRYVPAAVLAGLVFPEFVSLGAGGPGPDRLIAGAVAIAVAWRTENVLGTLVAGMGTLWVLRFLIP